ncbi:MAG: 50S ribosomal protein L13 [Puniceicoccales bacterium]|jgi:large subunit ribosomal protein L13|nr:50S ribosomal protein L13 [Puniceicoccales bacterium]
MKTTLAAVEKACDKRWCVIDAEGEILGRLAVKIANVLRGRNKSTYAPHMDMGDFVVIVNAEKVVLTGKKEQNKEYMFFSGYQSGDSRVNVESMRAKKPKFIIEHAVRGMLPRNRLASALMRKLKVYAGPEHPHGAQNPIVLAK